MRVGLIDVNIMHGDEFAQILTEKPRPDLSDVQLTHWFSTADPGRIRGTYYPGERPILPPEQYAARYGIPHVVRSPEEMIGEVDAVVICSRFGDENLRYARPFLSAGVPTFLDKPASYAVADTREILRLVRERDIPFLCSSLWKFTPAVQGLLQQMGPLGEIRTAVCTGPGHDELFFYGTHSVETVQWMLGHGAHAVSCHADENRYAIVVRMADGRIGFANAIRHTAVMRHVVAYCERGFVQAEITEPQRHAGAINILAHFVAMVKGEVDRYPLALVEEGTAILVAAERSAREGGRLVDLDEVVGASAAEAATP